MKLINDQDGIIDLMLSRKFKHGPNKIEHLVLELKRPKVKLGGEELLQIETYATTVAENPKFSKDNVI